MRTRPFPREGLVRLRHILAPEGPVPVSKSTWYSWITQGRVPPPIKPTPRIAMWRAEDVWKLMGGDHGQES